jgi:hypothetical protein
MPRSSPTGTHRLWTTSRRIFECERDITSHLPGVATSLVRHRAILPRARPSERSARRPPNIDVVTNTGAQILGGRFHHENDPIHHPRSRVKTHAQEWCTHGGVPILLGHVSSASTAQVNAGLSFTRWSGAKAIGDCYPWSNFYTACCAGTKGFQSRIDETLLFTTPAFANGLSNDLGGTHERP